jgi:hypothetical protein
MVDRDSAREEPAAKGKSALSGIRKLLLPHPDARSAVSALARALFAPIRKGPGAETRQDLVKFLGRVALFGDLRKGELKRLARVVHKRRYADGESILEQGRPGAALFKLAAMADAIRWVSARARGPVTLLALGRSDLDALSRNFPTLANKILRQLVQVVSARVQLLLERDFPAAQDGEPES